MSNRGRLLAMLLAASLLGGCGTGGDSGTAGTAREARSARPGRCQVGSSALEAIPAAPAWWQEGKGDPIALACLPGDQSGGAALVGFAFGPGSCVVSYRFRAEESFDERCTEPGTSWTIQCEGRSGCMSAFMHEPGLTLLDGPVDAKVGRVEASVDGLPLEDGVMFASVKGRLLRSIGASEPFGFFFAAIPRCVAPSAVRIELFARDGSRLGPAQGWDVIVQPCHELAGGHAPSA